MAEPYSPDDPPPGTEAGTETPPTEMPGSDRRFGRGFQGRLFIFLAVSLAVLALAGALFSAYALKRQAEDAFAAKAEVTARSLATASQRCVADADRPSCRALIDALGEIEGVAYSAIFDAGDSVLADSFGGRIPGSVLAANPGSGGSTFRQVELTFTDPSGGETQALDTAAPIRGGRLGEVRVGMDRGEVTAEVRRAVLPILALLGTLFLLALVAAYFFARRTVRPLRDLAAAAERLGGGDLEAYAPVTSGDEVGFVAETFNHSVSRIRNLVEGQEETRRDEQAANEQLQANIREFLQVAMQMARGDLTLRGKVTEDVLGNVVDSINLVVEEIGDLLGGVRAAADTVNAEARSMIGISDRMVSGVQTQVEMASQVESDVTEMTRAVRTVSDSAEGSSSAARRTLEAAQQGQAAVEGTLDGMRGIRGEVQAISKRIKALGDRSLEISEIVDTITNISSQTNLLALNAAIEASGAGAEGSRFGIVANEVRSLAQDTTAATKRVASLVEAVQAEVADAVVAMEAGTEKVESGFKVANEAGERLREIASASGDSASLANEISRAARDQVGRAERVSAGVATIVEVAEQTQVSVADGRSLAEQLLKLSERLRESLARFKTQEWD